METATTIFIVIATIVAESLLERVARDIRRLSREYRAAKESVIAEFEQQVPNQSKQAAEKVNEQEQSETIQEPVGDGEPDQAQQADSETPPNGDRQTVELEQAHGDAESDDEAESQEETGE